MSIPSAPGAPTSGAESRRSRLPDWIVLAQERWDLVERRNQLLARALAAREPRARFLFAEQPLRPREIRAWRWPRLRQVTPSIWSLRPIRPLPDSVSERLSDKIESAQIRWGAKRLGLERPMLWTQDPRGATIVDRLPVDGIVYDLTDDWAAFESEPAGRLRVQRRTESLGRRADLVLACSRPLENIARTWSGRVRYLPNAVEAPHDACSEPAALRRLDRPRLGYAGTLHSTRLDVELLARAAELRPDWSFPLLGPDMLEREDRLRLFSLPNVHYLGVCAHAEVRSYLAGFDVCLLPNRVTDFTRSLDPLKLYEYLAAGRSVIATPAGIPAELAGEVSLASTAEELVDRAQRALREDSQALAAARREAVAAHSWEARAEAIESALGVQRPVRRRGEVSVVIVSSNNCELLERSLRSVRAQSGVTLQTIVVDNASTDGSPERVRHQFPEVELVELPVNTGFAHANNVAFRLCRGEYVLLLNPDAFPHPGSLQALRAVAERHPGAGAVGPRLANADGTLQRSAWPFPRAGRLLLEATGLHRVLRSVGLLVDLGVWAHDEERPVDFLTGACLLLRAEALAEVIGFDEGFWLYGEESDLQRRLRTRGWSVVYTPEAVVTHLGEGSPIGAATRLRSFYAGQRRFLQKHGGFGAWPLARVALLIGSVLRRRWAAARIALRPL